MATLEYALKTNSGDIIAVLNSSPEIPVWEKTCGSDEVTVLYGQPEAVREYKAMPVKWDSALWIIFGDDKGNAKHSLVISRMDACERFELSDCKTAERKKDLTLLAADNMPRALLNLLDSPKTTAPSPGK